MYQEIGFQKDSQGEYKAPQCIHMDCLRWAPLLTWQLVPAHESFASEAQGSVPVHAGPVHTLSREEDGLREAAPVSEGTQPLALAGS